MSRRTSLSIAVGISITLVLFGLANAASAAGLQTLAQLLFWQNTFLQSLVPLGNIGTAAHPIYEGTPLNFLAFQASFPLGSIFYGLAEYLALGLAARRA